MEDLEVGLGPGDFVLDGDPVHLSQKEERGPHLTRVTHSNIDFDITVYSETKTCFHFCLRAKSTCSRGRLQMGQYGGRWKYGIHPIYDG